MPVRQNDPPENIVRSWLKEFGFDPYTYYTAKEQIPPLDKERNVREWKICFTSNGCRYEHTLELRKGGGYGYEN